MVTAARLLYSRNLDLPPIKAQKTAVKNSKVVGHGGLTQPYAVVRFAVERRRGCNDG